MNHLIKIFLLLGFFAFTVDSYSNSQAAVFSEKLEIKSKIEFEKFLSNDSKNYKIAVVYFSASWCYSCNIFGPVFSEVASEDTDVRYIKIDSTSLNQLSNEMEIKYLPTLLVYVDGKQRKEISRIGGMSRDDFRKWIGVIKRNFLRNSTVISDRDKTLIK